MFKKKKKIEEPKKDIRYALLPEYKFTDYGSVLTNDADAIYEVVEVEFITEDVDFIDECIIKYANHSFKIPSYKLFKDKHDAEVECKYLNRKTIIGMGIKLNKVYDDLNNIKSKLRDIFK